MNKKKRARDRLDSIEERMKRIEDEERKIEKEGECYILRVKDCEDVMKVTERFIVASYAHSNGIEV